MKDRVSRSATRRIVLVVAGSAAIAAHAADVVPLRRGTYVQPDTACAEASNATTRTFTGRGFDSASAAQCVARRVAGKRGTYRQTCTKYRGPEGAATPRSTETMTLRVSSPTSFVADGTRFRLCPGVS